MSEEIMTIHGLPVREYYEVRSKLEYIIKKYLFELANFENIENMLDDIKDVYDPQPDIISFSVSEYGIEFVIRVHKTIFKVEHKSVIFEVEDE